MLRQFNDLVTRITEFGLWAGFLAMITTVALQVMARNVLGLPFIWTLDLAQLLFSWLVFIGAAVAFRRGAHYTVDIWPEDRPVLDAALRILGYVAAAIVIFVMVRYGWNLTQIRWSGSVQSLGISRGWMFLPIPLSGVLMLFFLLESIWDGVRPKTA